MQLLGLDDECSDDRRRGRRHDWRSCGWDDAADGAFAGGTMLQMASSYGAVPGEREKVTRGFVVAAIEEALPVWRAEQASQRSRKRSQPDVPSRRRRD